MLPPFFGTTHVSVLLSFNGRDYCDGTLLYTFVPVKHLTIRPNLGPASGGTPVWIQGAQFSSARSYICAFGIRRVSSDYFECFRAEPRQ